MVARKKAVPNIFASAANGNTFTKNMQLQVHFGPYFAVGDNELASKNIDAGIQVGIGGLFMKHVYIGVSYDLGLMDVCDSYNRYRGGIYSNGIYRNNFSIVAGFNF